MAIQPPLHSLGELMDLVPTDQTDRAIFDRIVKLAHSHLPPGWQEWKANRYSRDGLLGEELDPQVLNKLRFALPTVGIAHAFSPGASSLSEKTYRDAKVKMLDWPFCIGLIIGPPSLAARVRGSATQNEIVLAALTDLKPLLISRKQASQQLAAEGDEVSSEPPSLAPSSKSSTDNRLSRLEQSNAELRVALESFMSRFQPRDVEADSGSHEEDFSDDDGSHLSDTSDHDTTWEAPSLTSNQAPEFDFTPRTKEQEPSILAAKPHIEAQGIECQKLGKNSFSRIRYSEVQKRLQASPVFAALRVNPPLMPCFSQTHEQEQLSRADLTLGTILHGLLLQREAFSEGMKRMLSKHPAIKPEVEEFFVGPDSSFKSLSDDVLQYVCGRRAEIIEQRRKLVKCNNDYVAQALASIPPSTTFLFEEEPLDSLIRQHEGFFRGLSKGKGGKFESNRKFWNAAPSANRPNSSKTASTSNSSFRRSAATFGSKTSSGRFSSRTASKRSYGQGSTTRNEPPSKKKPSSSGRKRS